MYKDFKSKFSILAEEETNRWKSGAGVSPGDYVVIRKDVFKSPKLAGRPSDFFKKIQEIMSNGLPTKASAIKSERPETQHGLYGGADAPTAFWVDVVQLANPALFVNNITLPVEVLDVVHPEGNNFSPDLPDQWKYDNKVQIKPKAVKSVKDETDAQTSGSKRNLPTKNSTDVQGKEPKDGRDQAKKPKKYKESFENDNDMLTEAYSTVHQEAKPAPYIDKPLTIDNKDVLTLTEAYTQIK